MHNERRACEYKCEYHATDEELKSPRDTSRNNLTYRSHPVRVCIIHANFCSSRLTVLQRQTRRRCAYITLSYVAFNSASRAHDYLSLSLEARG